MVNPFDRSFFKFVIGFVLLLLASFTLIYFTEKYGTSAPPLDAAAHN